MSKVKKCPNYCQRCFSFSADTTTLSCQPTFSPRVSSKRAKLQSILHRNCGQVLCKTTAASQTRCAAKQPTDKKISFLCAFHTSGLLFSHKTFFQFLTCSDSSEVDHFLFWPVQNTMAGSDPRVQRSADTWLLHPPCSSNPFPLWLLHDEAQGKTHEGDLLRRPVFRECQKCFVIVKQRNDSKRMKLLACFPPPKRWLRLNYKQDSPGRLFNRTRVLQRNRETQMDHMMRFGPWGSFCVKNMLQASLWLIRDI